MGMDTIKSILYSKTQEHSKGQAGGSGSEMSFVSCWSLYLSSYCSSGYLHWQFYSYATTRNRREPFRPGKRPRSFGQPQLGSGRMHLTRQYAGSELYLA
jgi:hypothetical protein